MYKKCHSSVNGISERNFEIDSRFHEHDSVEFERECHSCVSRNPGERT